MCVFVWFCASVFVRACVCVQMCPRTGVRFLVGMPSLVFLIFSGLGVCGSSENCGSQEALAVRGDSVNTLRSRASSSTNRVSASRSEGSASGPIPRLPPELIGHILSFLSHAEACQVWELLPTVFVVCVCVCAHVCGVHIFVLVWLVLLCEDCLCTCWCCSLVWKACVFVLCLFLHVCFCVCLCCCIHRTHVWVVCCVCSVCLCVHICVHRRWMRGSLHLCCVWIHMCGAFCAATTLPFLFLVSQSPFPTLDVHALLWRLSLKSLPDHRPPLWCVMSGWTESSTHQTSGAAWPCQQNWLARRMC